MKINKGFFITGTDTGVGKTQISCGILAYLQHNNYSTAALKPVASGCELAESGFINKDALLLQAVSLVKFSYADVNPVAFKPPTAPHIAAQLSQMNLSTNSLLSKCEKVLQASNIDFVIVEGIGGWLVPLNEKETMADFAKALNFPIIIVVAIRLGCLNHALLTHQHIVSSGLNIFGWVANCLDPEMDYQFEYIDTLKHWLKIPLLGTIPFLQNPDAQTISQYLTLPLS